LIRALRLVNDIQRAFIDRAHKTQMSPKTTSSALFQGYLDFLSSLSVSGEDSFQATLLVAAGYFEFYQDEMPIKVDNANRKVTIERNAIRMVYRIFDIQRPPELFGRSLATHSAISDSRLIHDLTGFRLKSITRMIAGIDHTFAWCSDEYRPDCFINASRGTCRYLAALQEFERLVENNKEKDFGHVVSCHETLEVGLLSQ